MSKKYRYPGSKPFEAQERSIFFGREEDIENLTRMIRVEPLVVLYGKSGLGKSSLLNAGVVPTLQENPNQEVIPIRFGSYIEGVDKPSPLRQVLQKLKQLHNTDSFLDNLSQNRDSLWHCFKGIQLNGGHHKRFILVFDQFEELFTYPDKDVRKFKEALVDILNNALPQEVRQAMKLQLQNDKQELGRDEMSQLYESLNTTLVFAIRSDRLSLMNRLRDFIPNILQRVYELRPLSWEQAEEAILSPAEIRDTEGQFYSPTFDYDDDALDKILDFLTNKHEKSIESFQLQILCQHIEESLVIKEYDTLISARDIGNLEHIYQNYYDNQIQKLSSVDDQTKARKLIEEGLIFEEEERRLSLYEGQIRRAYKVENELLRKLVDTHLIRSEPNSTGGFSYEISHDTLVGPILRSKERRKQAEREEERIQEERIAQKKKQEEQQRAFQRKLRQVGIIVFVIFIAIGLVEIAQQYQKNNELEESQKELTEARDKLQSTLESEQVAKAELARLLKSEKGQLQLEVKRWENKYQSLLDSLIIGEDNTPINPVSVAARVKSLEAENARLKRQYRTLLSQSSKEKYLAVKNLKALNQRLFDELWTTEYKSNKEWLKLKDGIIKDYQEFAKELE